MKNSISSVISCKCPRCHEGDMFKYSLIERPTKFMEMNEECPVCHLNFEQEPGYYYGAMYVSYGFAIIELVISLLLIKLIAGALNLSTIMSVIAIVYLVLSPINFRWGRAGWIALFFKYDVNANKSHS